ncbi:MAG: (2Fe-2S)-binding protein [Candidatus Heimdallarchaeota archaeon]|nr:MAG: (2Fe-2S)-binding protein [Candidatus Heimdallarchaeota archaeon]
MKIEIIVNGMLYKEETSPDRRLLDFLRDDLGMKGTKKGCDQGECGACSVILNGKVVNSCLILMVQLPQHSEVETIESTDSLVLSLQDSFVIHGATQCGACTPGMILASTVLLREKPHLTEQELREGLSGVICRCTGYQKIFDAIKDTHQKLSD